MLLLNTCLDKEVWTARGKSLKGNLFRMCALFYRSFPTTKKIVKQSPSERARLSLKKTWNCTTQGIGSLQIRNKSTTSNGMQRNKATDIRIESIIWRIIIRHARPRKFASTPTRRPFHGEGNSTRKFHKFVLSNFWNSDDDKFHKTEFDKTICRISERL